MQEASEAGLGAAESLELRMQFERRCHTCTEALAASAASGSLAQLHAHAKDAQHLGLTAEVAEAQACMRQRVSMCQGTVANALAYLLGSDAREGACGYLCRPECTGSAMSSRGAWMAGRRCTAACVELLSRAAAQVARHALLQSEQCSLQAQTPGHSGACRVCQQVLVLHKAAQEAMQLGLLPVATMARGAAAVYARARLAQLSRVSICSEVTFSYEGILQAVGRSGIAAVVAPLQLHHTAMQRAAQASAQQQGPFALDPVLQLVCAVRDANSAAALPAQPSIWPAAARHRAQLQAATALASQLTSHLSQQGLPRSEMRLAQEQCNADAPDANFATADVDRQYSHDTLAALRSAVGVHSFSMRSSMSACHRAVARHVHGSSCVPCWPCVLLAR